MTNPPVTTAHELAASRLYLLREDVDLLHELAEMLPIMALDDRDPWVADLGVGAGTTALAILEVRPDAVVAGVDISEDNLNWAEKLLENTGHKASWQRIHADASAAAVQFEAEVFDLVMLDTSHEYGATCRELAAWLPKLRPGGILWAHDYDGPESEGVRKVIEEAKAGGDLIEIAAKGWSWAGRKPRE